MVSEVAKLGKQVADMQEQLDNLLQYGVGLGRSSFNNGYLNQYTDGTLGSTFGTQFDDTNGVYPVNGPRPPTPRWTEKWGPSVEAIVGGLRVRWEGYFEPDDAVFAPSDYKNVEIYVTDQTSSPSILFSYMKTTISSSRGGEILLSLPVETSGFYVWLVTRTLAGQVSDFSQVLGPFTPLKIRESDLGFTIDDIIGTTIWYGADDPALAPGSTVHGGDLWLKDVTPDGAETPQYLTYRRMPDGTWALLADQGATQAIAAAIAAQQAADAKAKVFVQATEPTWEGPAGSAIWMDSGHNNIIYTWNGSDFVIRRLGNGAIEPHSLIASDVIATGSVTAALLEAILVLATTIIAGNPTGTHVEIREDGVYVYANDLVDGVPNEVVRMGTDTNDYFGITDANGLLQLSLDVTGAVNARTANFREDIVIQGRPLLSTIVTAIPGGGGPGTPAPGACNWLAFAPGSEIGGVASEIGLFSAAVTVEAGRWYDVIPAFYYNVSTSNTFVTSAVRDGGPDNPTLSSPLITQDFGPAGNQPSWTLLHQPSRPWVPTTSGVHTLLVTVAAGGDGTVNVVNTGNGRAPTLELIDRGPWRGNPAVVNRGGGGPSQPPTVQRIDTGWMAPHAWWSYRGNGSARSDTTDVVQGWDPSGFNGDGQGFWWWDLPTITGTVKEVWVWLQSNSTYYNSGGVGIIAPVKAGAAYPLTSYMVASQIQYGTFPKPGTLQMNLSGWNNLFHSGQGVNRAIGIAVGPTGGTNETFYVRFDGPSARMRIVYEQ